jgi:hypothetical protein
MALTQIVYVSSAKTSFGKPEVLELLRTSRLNNERAGLTGILLYKDGNFLQVLEGEGSAVQALFEKICADPRHGGVFTLLKSEIAAREFPDWSMAFRDLRDEALAQEPAFNEFLNLSLDDPAIVTDPSRARKLLAVFHTSMR